MTKDLFKTISSIMPESRLVGGALRNALLGRPSPDIDIAVSPGGIKAKTAALAAALKGKWFTLDDKNKVYRIIPSGSALTIDVCALQGAGIREDLERRDFTINAMAYPVSKLTGAIPASKNKKPVKIAGIDVKLLLDPCGGLKDLKTKTVRIASPGVFADDPLRLLRAFRIAAELGFSIDKKTLSAVKKNAPRIPDAAGERIHEELVKLLALPKSAAWLGVMDKAGLLTTIFPELQKQKKCARVYYGGGGVFKHTLAVVDRMEFLLDHFDKAFPPRCAGRLKEWRDKAALLKLACLLHDIAKPATARMIGGRLRFFLHEDKGAEMAEAKLNELRFSRQDSKLISQIIRGHLRPGNLASNSVITPKAIYRFFRDTGDAALPLLMVCWADHASYISPAAVKKTLRQTHKPPKPLTRKLPREGLVKTLRHQQVINLMISAYCTNPHQVSPSGLVTGNDVIKILGIPPGPDIGKALDAVRTAQAESKFKTRGEALAYIGKMGKKLLNSD